jgi:hypothetical protein
MAILSEQEEKFFESSMASSVTRHALIPFEEGFKFLLCGIDSLDLGGFVEWNNKWEQRRDKFQNRKEQAQGTNGLLCSNSAGRKYVQTAKGKPPQFRYHLQFPEYHLYIGISQTPQKTPNVYISFNAEALWHLGVDKCVQLATRDIRAFGGDVLYFQPSRCDLSADFFIPGDLSLPFLNSHKVCRSSSQRQFLSDDKLETFYIGATSAPVQLRIYDKGKEILKSGKPWFQTFWGKDDPTCVWRVEFQLRRTVLREFRIETVDCLRSKLGGLWQYLTEDWFSLRLPNHERQDRRELHHWWTSVQSLADQFGPTIELQRLTEGEFLVPIDWYVSHIAGCLPSLAARTQTVILNDALNHLTTQITEYWFERDFKDEVQKRTIKLGKHPTEESGDEQSY